MADAEVPPGEIDRFQAVMCAWVRGMIQATRELEAGMPNADGSVGNQGQGAARFDRFRPSDTKAFQDAVSAGGWAKVMPEQLRTERDALMARVAELDRALVGLARDRRDGVYRVPSLSDDPVRAEFGPPAGETTAFETSVNREIHAQGAAAQRAEDREWYRDGCDRPAEGRPEQWVETSPQSGTTAPRPGMIWVSGHGWMDLTDPIQTQAAREADELKYLGTEAFKASRLGAPVAPPLPVGATFLTEWDRDVLNIVRQLRAAQQVRSELRERMKFKREALDAMDQQHVQANDAVRAIDDTLTVLLKCRMHPLGSYQSNGTDKP